MPSSGILNNSAYPQLRNSTMFSGMRASNSLARRTQSEPTTDMGVTKRLSLNGYHVYVQEDSGDEEEDSEEDTALSSDQLCSMLKLGDIDLGNSDYTLEAIRQHIAEYDRSARVNGGNVNQNNKGASGGGAGGGFNELRKHSLKLSKSDEQVMKRVLRLCHKQDLKYRRAPNGELRPTSGQYPPTPVTRHTSEVRNISTNNSAATSTKCGLVGPCSYSDPGRGELRRQCQCIIEQGRHVRLSQVRYDVSESDDSEPDENALSRCELDNVTTDMRIGYLFRFGCKKIRKTDADYEKASDKLRTKQLAKVGCPISGTPCQQRATNQTTPECQALGYDKPSKHTPLFSSTRQGCHGRNALTDTTSTFTEDTDSSATYMGGVFRSRDDLPSIRYAPKKRRHTRSVSFDDNVRSYDDDSRRNACVLGGGASSICECGESTCPRYHQAMVKHAEAKLSAVIISGGKSEDISTSASSTQSEDEMSSSYRITKDSSSSDNSSGYGGFDSNISDGSDMNFGHSGDYRRHSNGHHHSRRHDHSRGHSRGHELSGERNQDNISCANSDTQVCYDDQTKYNTYRNSNTNYPCMNNGYKIPQDGTTTQGHNHSMHHNHYQMQNYAQTPNFNQMLNPQPMQNVQPMHNSHPTQNCQTMQNCPPMQNYQPMQNSLHMQNSQSMHNSQPMQNFQPMQNAQLNCQPAQNFQPFLNLQHMQNSLPTQNYQPMQASQPQQNCPSTTKTTLVPPECEAVKPKKRDCNVSCSKSHKEHDRADGEDDCDLDDEELMNKYGRDKYCVEDCFKIVKKRPPRCTTECGVATPGGKHKRKLHCGDDEGSTKSGCAGGARQVGAKSAPRARKVATPVVERVARKKRVNSRPASSAQGAPPEKTACKAPKTLFTGDIIPGGGCVMDTVMPQVMTPRKKNKTDCFGRNRQNNCVVM